MKALPIPRWKAHPSVAESYGPEEPKIAAVERRQAARSPLRAWSPQGEI